MKRKTWGLLVLAAMAANVMAQSGTNSPYSQYGLGSLADQSQGFNKAMNGVGIGMQAGNQVNVLNPASYAGVDSLTMLFDMGLSGQFTSFEEGATRVNAKNADFDYAVASFRAFRNLGVGLGVVPFSSVGYKYNSSTYLDNTNGTITETYNGSGGFHQLFLGVGWRVLKPLSVGANVSYLWGNYEKSVVSSSTTYVKSLKKVYSTSVHDYKIDLGAQWQQPLGQKDLLVIGATLGLGHKLNADPQLDVVNVNDADTTTFKVTNGLELPFTYGAGFSYRHAHKILVGADVTVQKWGNLDFPDLRNNAYVLFSGMLKDRYQVKLGGEWTPNERSRKFLDRVHYRVGAGYATPYYIINGQDGPKEFSVSAGFGIPIMNVMNNRSVLNISGQWVHAAADGLLTENTLRINIGLTFNESWFKKWKVE